MLATLLSRFLLLASPTTLDQSIEVIRQHHLETVDGRVDFLNNELTPYAASVEELNKEITALSEQAEALSPEEDQEEIASLAKQVAEKMDEMTKRLPSIELAMHVDEDLQQVDAILGNPGSVTLEQQAAADRLAGLCLALDEFNH
ncbi:MAG TPA: hypothetical protein VLF94_02290 [Chlamydiales bacterium]|nr:hypothetical protein [Chlamydiales bacterium]